MKDISPEWFLERGATVAKKEYLTEYPAILKEKAKRNEVKIKNADYRFLDYFMFIQEEAEYSEVQMELKKESKEIFLSFTTCKGVAIQIVMAAHAADEVKFIARVARIPASLVEAVGESILTGSFINNHLALQITLGNVGESYADIVMEGKFLVDCHGKDAASRCSIYLLMFIEEINQISYLYINQWFLSGLLVFLR